MSNGQVAWEKAMACELHARSTEDKVLQSKFRKLRDSWIRIGNSAQFEGHVIDANVDRPREKVAALEPSGDASTLTSMTASANP